MSTHGWQPIATAPRDGTAILIGCAKGEKGWGVSVAAWCEFAAVYAKG